VSKENITIRVVVETTLPKALAGLLKRNGFSVFQSGSYKRLRIGDEPIARQKVKISIEDVNGSDTNPPKGSETSGVREGTA
jgi:hypothetical protein